MDRIETLRGRVVEGRGELDPTVRRAAYDDDRALLSEPLSSYVELMHKHAFKITDEDVRALGDSLSEDQVFELTVAAAVGAGLERLEILTRAMEDH